MATVDKLAIYNNALVLIGQRRLATLTDDVEPRYLLDAAYDVGGPEYCMEIVQPDFASIVTKLDSPAVSAEHGLDSVHALPADYLTLATSPGIYSDDKLDQPVSRYLIEGRTIVCEFDTIYVRYISDTITLTDWTPSFVRVLTTYLAREIAIKLAPDQYASIDSLFTDRVEAARGLDDARAPDRSTAPTVTLNNTWRRIYNDALMIMGLDEITANNDDSNRRVKLDRVLDADLVASQLEDTGWTFALTSTQIDYNPSIEPSWGYQRAHDKPADMQRINGIYHDEYMEVPLKSYRDEGSYFFSDSNTIYVQYVSTDFLTTPDNWPAFFKRLIAARMAKDAAKSLKNEGADPQAASDEYEVRRKRAMADDAMAAPPRLLAGGNWVASRQRNSYRGNYRGRP